MEEDRDRDFDLERRLSLLAGDLERDFDLEEDEDDLRLFFLGDLERLLDLRELLRCRSLDLDRDDLRLSRERDLLFLLEGDLDLDLDLFRSFFSFDLDLDLRRSLDFDRDDLRFSLDFDLDDLRLSFDRDLDRDLRFSLDRDLDRDLLPFLLFFLLPDDLFGVDDLERDLEALLLFFLDFFPSLLLSTVPASLPSLSSCFTDLTGEGDNATTLLDEHDGVEGTASSAQVWASQQKSLVHGSIGPRWP